MLTQLGACLLRLANWRSAEQRIVHILIVSTLLRPVCKITPGFLGSCLLARTSWLFQRLLPSSFSSLLTLSVFPPGPSICSLFGGSCATWTLTYVLYILTFLKLHNQNHKLILTNGPRGDSIPNLKELYLTCNRGQELQTWFKHNVLDGWFYFRIIYNWVSFSLIFQNKSYSLSF